MTFEAATPSARRRPRKRRSSAAACEAVAPGFETGLSGQMQRMRRQNEGISRWLALAVLVGSIVAFVFINFFAQ